jgi:hypothetical protein
MMLDTLEIFDFDWTLFRSPHPPGDVPRKSWLHHPKSLLPPVVPLRPGSEFWIEEVVREIKAAQRRRNTITAVITARRAKAGERIQQLLAQKFIDPDHFCLREASYQRDKDKMYFKRREVLSILKQHPSITRIVVWEDHPGHIDDYKAVADRKGLKFEGNLVTEPGGMADALHYND